MDVASGHRFCSGCMKGAKFRHVSPHGDLKTWPHGEAFGKIGLGLQIFHNVISSITTSTEKQIMILRQPTFP